MWLLRNDDKGLVYRIQPGKPNVVTRKDGDLLLLGDQSISRKHAEIIVNNENQRVGIVLKDLGSKYGTFTALAGEEFTQVSPNQLTTLQDGAVIRFGIQWNVWRVEYFPLVVATSTLNATEKTEVKEVVAALGGEVANDWQPCCTHLTMSQLTVTVKVVCALACGKPIVVPGYWKTLKNSLASTETKLPDIKEFVPPLAEALLNPSEVSFTPNPERAKLFSGYTFIAASTKQLGRIKPMISAAGGNAVEFTPGSWPLSKLKQDRVVLMQHTATKQGSQQSQVPNGYLDAARKLKADGVRCIPEAEIGLSILYCSMDQHCNPKFSPQSLFGGSSTQNTQQITVICPSSEEPINPKSTGDLCGATSSKKRGLENANDNENPRKKVNSEDIFSSQGDESRIDQNANLPSTSSNKLAAKENKPIVSPSLDMFAPSGQSVQNKNTLNKSTTNSENVEKAKQLINPSLDMFAPSGQSSNKGNQNQITSSCHDIFASNESRQNQKRTNNETSSISNKKPRVNDNEGNENITFSTNKSSNCQKPVTEKDDEFSFVPPRRSNQQYVSDDEDDAFSFVSSKKSNHSKIIEDEDDAFSFVSSKKSNHSKIIEDKDDAFSFVSSKSSKKRNRPSNPDMFVSNNTSASNNRPSDSVTNNHSFTANHNEEEDDLFAFPGGPALKKRKEKDSSQNENEPDEVHLAILCKADSNMDLQNASEPVVYENPDETKNIVYSKDKSRIKKEDVCDAEMDDLAKELYNKTIIIVKPLVVVRPKPLVEARSTSGGKNFKKFRKVHGLNKRTVPHIIGGSDLVPHFAMRDNENVEELPLSPPPVEPDDDWAFMIDKKKGRKR